MKSLPNDWINCSKDDGLCTSFWIRHNGVEKNLFISLKRVRYFDVEHFFFIGIQDVNEMGHSLLNDLSN